MDDPPAVGVLDRLADLHQSPEQLAEPHRRPRPGAVILPDRVPEAVPPDQPHRVEGPPPGIPAHAVDGHDPGVLQHPGDPPFQDEPDTALGVVGAVLPDRLQRDLTPEIPVDGPVDQPQAPLGVQGQDLEPGGRLPGRVVVPTGPGFAGWSERVAPGGEEGHRFRDVHRLGTSRLPHDPGIGLDRGRGRPVVMSSGERVPFGGGEEPVTVFRGQGPGFPEELPERPRGVVAPRVERLQEGRRVDEPLPEGEEAREEAAIRVIFRHGKVPRGRSSPG